MSYKKATVFLRHVLVLITSHIESNLMNTHAVWIRANVEKT